MNNKKKKDYEAPQLTEFDCRVERGFAGSTTEESRSMSSGSPEDYKRGTGNEAGGYVFS